VLELNGELAIARLRKREHRYTGSADEILSNLFSDLAKWSATPGWTGAGFTRLVMELADLPGHPARAVARRHKAAVEEWWGGLLRTAGVASPSERAREVMLLMEGAMAMILIHGDREYANTAAQAVKRLVSKGALRQASSSRSRRITPAS
jgi:Tetracyclin repressor-like, C-terminal domain